MKKKITSRKEKKIYKMKIKNYAENKNTRVHTFTIGDNVLLEQKKINKWTTSYELEIYIVYNIKGSSIWGGDCRTDGKYVGTQHVSNIQTGRKKNRRNTTKGEHIGVKDDKWR